MAIRDIPGQPVVGFFSFTAYERPLPAAVKLTDVVKVGHAPKAPLKVRPARRGTAKDRI